MVFVPASSQFPEVRRPSTGSQPSSTQPIHSSTPLQNGVIKAGLHHDQSRRLRHQYRSYGRIPPRTGTPVFKAFPSIRLERSSVPVLSTSIRNVPINNGLHQNSTSNAQMGTTQRHTSGRLPRRLTYRSKDRLTSGKHTKMVLEKLQELGWRFR